MSQGKVFINILQYQWEAENTKSEFFHGEHIGSRNYTVFSGPEVDLLHGAIGLATEAGELLDPFKKALFYNKPLDLVNLKEELGDILWYVAIMCTALGTTIEEVATINNAKLKARYPEKFSLDRSENRNLDAERRILEGKE